MRLLAVLFFGVVAVAAACRDSRDGATPTAPAGTGIEGTVTIGPACPVERVDSPCPDRPYEAGINVVDERGEVVARVRSAADGTFRIDLPPGSYTLRPATTGTPPSARDVDVTVLAGSYAHVSIQYDSGIR